MQQMQVTVPAGVGPGMAFQVNTPAGPMQVTCPPGATAGGQMLVNVPAAPQPVVMAQPVSPRDTPVVAAQPIAAPQPMVMAQPMMAQPMMGQPMMGQPMMGQPMAQPVATGAGSGLPFKLSINVGQKAKMSELKARSQSPIPVISPSEWSEIIDAIDATQRANPFYDCPVCECVYFCVPGGPIQMLLCIVNPITCICHFMPVEAAKKAAKAKIDPIVSKYGLKFRWEDQMEIYAIIEQQ